MKYITETFDKVLKYADSHGRVMLAAMLAISLIANIFLFLGLVLGFAVYVNLKDNKT